MIYIIKNKIPINEYGYRTNHEINIPEKLSPCYWNNNKNKTKTKTKPSANLHFSTKIFITINHIRLFIYFLFLKLCFIEKK